jgi:hypothetical protein
MEKKIKLGTKFKEEARVKALKYSVTPLKDETGEYYVLIDEKNKTH